MGDKKAYKINQVFKVFQVQNFREMASIESYIDEFIAEHELDSESVKEPLTDLINKVNAALFKHLYSEQIPENTVTATVKKPVSNKAKKDDKIEDPTLCEKLEDLRNCTTGILNQYCKDQGLKVGGNKKDLMDRVWRHLQGTNSDDDKSPRSKPKKEKVVPEKHVCFGCNAKGAPCAMAATEEFDEHWFCWRHIKEAAEIIEKKPSNEPAKSEIEPAKTDANKPKKSKKVKVPVVELITSDEE